MRERSDSPCFAEHPPTEERLLSPHGGRRPGALRRRLRGAPHAPGAPDARARSTARPHAGRHRALAFLAAHVPGAVAPLVWRGGEASLPGVRDRRVHGPDSSTAPSTWSSTTQSPAARRTRSTTRSSGEQVLDSARRRRPPGLVSRSVHREPQGRELSAFIPPFSTDLAR